jgi:hypothetical protein
MLVRVKSNIIVKQLNGSYHDQYSLWGIFL